MSNVPKINIDFHSEAVETSNGVELKIQPGMSILNIFVTGDVTSSTCNFEGQDTDGNWYLIKCANLTTLSMAVSTSGIDEVWQASLVGLNKFRVRISALTVGAGEFISVKGRVVG